MSRAPPREGPSPTGVAVSPEVEAALASGGAVVALESTIICHGMPYPKNLQTAMEVEAIVRENGAVPATIAILNGVPHVGLNSEQLKNLAISGSQFQKTARRDIAQVVASGSNGATTVSATMFFAHKVGIPIFVTGGIGGVHRYGEKTMDISSDLTELGKTPVAVISAGVKSILDIARTLEHLETQGVTVAAYRTNEFPAFFTETSGCKVPCRVDSPEECAKIIYANQNMHLGSGILIAVPVPKQHAASGKVIESAIQQSLKEAEYSPSSLLSFLFLYVCACTCSWVNMYVYEQYNVNLIICTLFLSDKRIIGNAITPFILDRVKVLTGGSSLEANIALVKNNALTGAKIAVALSDLRKRVTNRPVRSAL
ncbi:pseudouridine-5'-phosphate glycosidase isoform X1 [Aegilops tauschii subsp. strangulata]|uniref:pseudouridine-5'-phosphate glycosidase isoform X1 n=1 Tax=Aegilops tauschii subsp. strangulata TaxID=200361 RepID=UPI000989B759|nr:pseudouridine-5'-phosphate glycosidase isoform X1 [Aegilops tauschii subsp. strangulata]